MPANNPKSHSTALTTVLTKATARPGANAKGFTIIELMVSVAILAIIAAFAAPSLTTFIKNSRLEQQSQEFYALLNKARQLAITSGRRVFICKSSDITTPTCNITANGEWDLGKLIYSAPAGTTIPTPSSNFISHVYQTLSSSMTDEEKRQMINGVIEAPRTNISIQSNNDNVVLVFTSQGLLENTGAPLLFSICDDRATPENYGKYLSVSQSGRIKLSATGTSTGDIKCDATEAT